MNKQISEQALASYVAKLPQEMQPQRDLWAGIEHAIENKSQQRLSENKKSRIMPMAWAASLVIAILVTWVSFAPTSSQVATPLSANTRETLPPQVGQLFRSMQESFQQQKQAMLVSYGKPELSNLPVTMQNQLIALAQARKALEQALVNDENNVDLLNLLRFTQQQELTLLQQLYPYMSNENAHWQTI